MMCIGCWTSSGTARVYCSDAPSKVRPSSQHSLFRNSAPLVWLKRIWNQWPWPIDRHWGNTLSHQAQFGALLPVEELLGVQVKLLTPPHPKYRSWKFFPHRCKPSSESASNQRCKQVTLKKADSRLDCLMVIYSVPFGKLLLFNLIFDKHFKTILANTI